MYPSSYFRSIPLLALLLCCRTAASAQNACDMEASIIHGAECNLVYVGGLVLLPCSAPIGFYALPVGTPLLLSYTPNPCISFCLQGMGADIQCAQVVGGTNVALCAGQSINIGAPAEPNRHYQWSPVYQLNCDTCALASINPPENAIYSRTETIPACLSCQPVITYYNVAVSPCSGVSESAEQSVTLSPVPTDGLLRVQGFDFDQFRIFDPLGKLVLAGPANHDQIIDLSPLSTGMYYLQLHSKEAQILRKVWKAPR